MALPPPRVDNITTKSQKDLVREFVDRYGNLRREQEELKDQMRDLQEEYETQGLDIKTLKKALRVVDIVSKVKHRSTFDDMYQQLEKELVKSV